MITIQCSQKPSTKIIPLLKQSWNLRPSANSNSIVDAVWDTYCETLNQQTTTITNAVIAADPAFSGDIYSLGDQPRIRLLILKEELAECQTFQDFELDYFCSLLAKIKDNLEACERFFDAVVERQMMIYFYRVCMYFELAEQFAQAAHNQVIFDYVELVRAAIEAIPE